MLEILITTEMLNEFYKMLIRCYTALLLSQKDSLH